MAKTPTLGSLLSRFGALWSRCVMPDVASHHALAYEQLKEAYTDPHRHYHGWGHVRHCLKQFDLAAGLMQDPDAVEMALWFHDVVYKTGAPDNERQSAEWFVARATGQFPGERIDKIRDYILSTTHREPPADRDGCFVVDIDLSGLGANWEKFLRDSRQIRKECDTIPDHVFYPAQVRFLQSLLARPRVFYSEFFNRRYERRTRLNIARLIARG